MSDDREFERITPDGFDWDERKAAVNLAKHSIDFEDACDIFFEPVILHRSDRKNEERWTALGQLEYRLIVVVFT